MNTNRIRTPRKVDIALVMIFAAIALMRLVLIPKGHFHLQDELRYRYSFAFIREVINSHPIEATRQLFEFPLFARPLLVLFNLPPALLQVFFLVFTGVKTETPLSLSISSMYQVMITMGITWIFYRLSLMFLGSRFLSLSAVVVFSLLINSNLYVRHILPYDATLLLYLWMVLIVLSRYKTSGLRWSFCSGLFVAALHLVYPGYYLFGLIVAGITTFLPRNRWFLRGVTFTAAFVLVLLAIEILARALGGSYWQTAQFVAGRVIVGDPQETLIFGYRYLWQVEGIIGKVLVVGFSGLLIHLVLHWRHYPREFRLLAAWMVGSYLLHGISGPLLGKVFYGRSVRMFFWFVVLAVFMFLQRCVSGLRAQYLAGAVLVMVSLWSFSQWYPDFVNLWYPGDVLFSRAGPEYAYRVSEVNENYAPQSKENHPQERAAFLAINFGRFFFPEKETYRYDIQESEPIFRAPHPINFPAYQFEALGPKERKLIRNRNYEMKLYAR